MSTGIAQADNPYLDLPPEELERIEAQTRIELWRAEQRGRFEYYCDDPALFPGEPPARHHAVICEVLQGIAEGRHKRVMIFAPPGTAKSTYVSVRFPSWLIGHREARGEKYRVICASHTATLATRHGKMVRNLVDRAEYAEIFPDTALSDDSASKGDWATAFGSELYAVGFDGAIAGRRADGVIIDDPYKHRKDADSEAIRERVQENYKDIRDRLRADGFIVIMMTRWHGADLCGTILPKNWKGESGIITSRDGQEDWLVVNLQMENEFPNDLMGREIGELLWPEWKFTKDWVAREKVIQGTRDWGAKYQGRPQEAEGAIIKRAYWRKWPDKTPPVVDYVVQVWDTAYEEDEEDDFSACTTWGIFDIWAADNALAVEAARKHKDGEVQQYHAILLHAYKGKISFPKLKRMSKDLAKKYQPDRILIEAKASGISLRQELRRGGLPVRDLKADRSKLSRTHAAEPVFEQGCVWYMDIVGVEEMVIDECAAFPTGEHDDVHDTVMHAMYYLRRRWHLKLPDEEADEEFEKDELEHGDEPIYG